MLLIVAYNIDHNSKKKPTDIVKDIHSKHKQLQEWASKPEQAKISNQFAFITLRHFTKFLGMEQSNKNPYFKGLMDLEKDLSLAFKGSQEFLDFVIRSRGDRHYINFLKNNMHTL